MTRHPIKAVARIVVEARRRAAGRARPFVVAFDGRSGAGKSTLARAVGEALGGALVPSDDFFAADIPTARWDAIGPADDWRRLRRDALAPLLTGMSAAWFPFDFETGPGVDGTYATSKRAVVRLSAPYLILEGAYSSGPEVADSVDLSVLVQAPRSLREARLRLRENPAFLAEWHARWDAAEDYYFRRVRPPSSFDLVVNTTAAGMGHARADGG